MGSVDPQACLPGSRFQRGLRAPRSSLRPLVCVLPASRVRCGYSITLVLIKNEMRAHGLITVVRCLLGFFRLILMRFRSICFLLFPCIHSWLLHESLMPPGLPVFVFPGNNGFIEPAVVCSALTYPPPLGLLSRPR